MDELDTIRHQQCKAAGNTRPMARRVDLGRVSEGAPIVAVYPFMLDTAWASAWRIANPSETLVLRKKDPPGFGSVHSEPESDDTPTPAGSSGSFHDITVR